MTTIIWACLMVINIATASMSTARWFSWDTPWGNAGEIGLTLGAASLAVFSAVNLVAGVTV